VLVHSGWAVIGTASNYSNGYTTAWRWAEKFDDLMSAYPGTHGRLSVSRIPLITHTAKFRSPPQESSQAPFRGIGAERVMFGSDFNRPEPRTYVYFALNSESSSSRYGRMGSRLSS
jgi:hypothetical protein